LLSIESDFLQYFVRKGKVGDWRNFFTPEMHVEWEKWTVEKENQLGPDIKIPE